MPGLETTLANVDEARELAREIELALLGSRANVFNRPTSLKWDFDADVVAYNFRGADPVLLPLYYDHAFEAANRYVRSRGPDAKRLIVVIDEFFAMSSVRALEEQVAIATKTWRNYGAAMWTADQNARVYLGEEGLPSQWGPFTANNALLKAFFRQESTEAEAIAHAYADHLAPEHIRQIKTSGIAECIAMFGDEVHQLTVQLTPLEAKYFL